MNIIDMIEKGIKLYDQAAELLEKVKPSLENLGAGESSTVEEARDRLHKSMTRARAAHDSLNDAIDEQLAKGGR